MEYNLIGSSEGVSCLPKFPQAFTIIKVLIVSSLFLFCIVTTPIVTNVPFRYDATLRIVGVRDGVRFLTLF